MRWSPRGLVGSARFSALQRAEIAEKMTASAACTSAGVSVLFNEPKLLKVGDAAYRPSASEVSVLFNEPKLLKLDGA